MGSIQVAGVEYEINQTYLRSVHLQPQRLMHDIPENRADCFCPKERHPHNRFYLASSEGVWYWIKEYIWQHRKGTAWEAAQQAKYAGLHDEGRIGAVSLIASDATRIVSEYLDGYTSMSWISSRVQRQYLVDRVAAWMVETGIVDYDLSENNVMVFQKTNHRESVIRMIDFEYSTVANGDKNKRRIYREMVERSS